MTNENNVYNTPTIKDEIIEVLAEHGEFFEDCITTLTDEELNKSIYSIEGEFPDSIQCQEDRPDYARHRSGDPWFTVWGPKYVYFPLTYDGGRWIGYAPRFPDDREKTYTQGGG
jgi:hypothetical protein